MNAREVTGMLENAGLFEQFCGTWVRGLPAEDVARVLGADPWSAGLRTMHELNAERWRLPADRPVLLAGPIGDTHTLVVEPQSYLGAEPDRLRALSRDGGEAMNIHWTVNLDSGLALARDGVIVTALSLTAAAAGREGTDPAHLDQELAAAGFAPGQDLGERTAVAFTVAGRLTGRMLGADWFGSPQRAYLGTRRRR
ncbi:hypothetical protein Sru01_63630 [Sphaerisporangium rufum]|uniref:Uncharacterized protein n=1 Tax=Sphaerisporangium rufum TaxID=1381558 RepID=A0A919R833_9ACTN|nr:DUF6461 domain-containing protein [Sphaerisporangium rufum]GII81381.1 hypothetical protein Sru01_63630 [Sphaerisporangium rufum]